MAIDEGSAELMRGDLAHLSSVTEKRMFGGLAFMLNGNMLCGVHGAGVGGGAMYRVGKDNQAEALALPGAGPMEFTGRPMGGMVSLMAEAMGEDDVRARLLALAVDFVGALPAK